MSLQQHNEKTGFSPTHSFQQEVTETHPALKHNHDGELEIEEHRPVSAATSRTLQHGPTPDGEEPNDEEKSTLRHISDKIPMSAWLVAIVELSERFTYYGLTGPFQNYVENKRTYGPSEHSGALGLGTQAATASNYAFTMWCYLTPLLGAVIADSYLGRYKTICTFVAVYMVGILVLFITSLPSMLDRGAGLPGLIIAMLIIGLGAGGIKSNVSPLIAEQYTEKFMRIKTLKKGERVILDPNATIQRIYNIFYWCINIGSLSGIATTKLEHEVGFWAAFLLPFCFFWFAVLALVVGKKQYITRRPVGSILPRAAKACWLGMKSKFNMDAAKPSYQLRMHGVSSVPWDDLFIEELKRVLIACRVFVAYPIFWVAYGQMNSSLVHQAGSMETHKIPNDLMQNFNPLSIIILIPVAEKFLYPTLRKMHIPFRPITRITVGFGLVALAMAYAAIIQNMIYKEGPCYANPLKCNAAFPLGRKIKGVDADPLPNHVHVMTQIPIYVLTGLGEIFASITALEYAYTKAPASMKSVVQAAFLLTNAIGAVIGIGLSGTSKDPKFVITYSALAIATLVTATIFWFCFKKYNAIEEQLNELDAADPNAVAMPVESTNNKV